MAAKQVELNRYTLLKTKVQFIKADIWFLKRCKKMKVTPNFIKVKTAVMTKASEQTVKSANVMWLNFEIKQKYRALSNIGAELLNIHLKLTKSKTPRDIVAFESFDEKVRGVVRHKVDVKYNVQRAKIRRLCEQASVKNQMFEPEMVKDYIKNRSSVEFTDEELMFLNKGLNFALPPVEKVHNDIIMEVVTDMDVNNGLFGVPKEHKIMVKSEVKDILESYKSKNKASMKKTCSILKSLSEKGCVYSKADKGNSLVIMDKSEYSERVNRLIAEGPYVEIRCPLEGWKRTTSTMLNKYKKLLSKRVKYSLLVHNPCIPKLYALYKGHKPDSDTSPKVRPISANNNAPNEKVAKWLLKQFKKIPAPFSYSVKNAVDFAKKLMDVVIADDEVMVSFDVVSLYPSIPVKEAEKLLEQWLTENNVDAELKEMYMELLKLNTRNCFFQFEGRFYDQTEGLAMGNSLAPFIASDIFLGHLEKKISKESWFPRTWLRYIDDIFAIVKKDEVDSTLNYLNALYPNQIKFTVENEKDRCLAFLDLLVMRKDDERLHFKVYRKPTCTDRFITSDSFHCFQQKMASFNSMVYRMLNVPMSEIDKKEEEEKIFHIAKVNGYGKSLIEDIIRKQKRSLFIKTRTTLKRIKTKPVAWMRLSYFPPLTDKIKNILKSVNISTAYASDRKIRNVLCNNKDKTDKINKPGIYKMFCEVCKCFYVGQTCRPCHIRWGEHMKAIDDGDERSAVAKHIIDNPTHKVIKFNSELVKNINKEKYLNAWESYYIDKHKNDGIMNIRPPPLSSELFKFCT